MYCVLASRESSATRSHLSRLQTANRHDWSCSSSQPPEWQQRPQVCNAPPVLPEGDAGGDDVAGPPPASVSRSRSGVHAACCCSDPRRLPRRLWRRPSMLLVTWPYLHQVRTGGGADGARDGKEHGKPRTAASATFPVQQHGDLRRGVFACVFRGMHSKPPMQRDPEFGRPAVSPLLTRSILEPHLLPGPSPGVARPRGSCCSGELGPEVTVRSCTPLVSSPRYTPVRVRRRTSASTQNSLPSGHCWPRPTAVHARRSSISSQPNPSTRPLADVNFWVSATL